MDVLLHLELQKSAKIKAEIEQELEDVINVVDAYEMFKARGNSSMTFSQYLKIQDPEINNIHPTLDRRETTSSRRYDQAQMATMVTPSLSSVSTLLNRLKNIDIEDDNS